MCLFDFKKIGNVKMVFRSKSEKIIINKCNNNIQNKTLIKYFIKILLFASNMTFFHVGKYAYSCTGFKWANHTAFHWYIQLNFLDMIY